MPNQPEQKKQQAQTADKGTRRDGLRPDQDRPPFKGYNGHHGYHGGGHFYKDPLFPLLTVTPFLTQPNFVPYAYPYPYPYPNPYPYPSSYPYSYPYPPYYQPYGYPGYPV